MKIKVHTVPQGRYVCSVPGICFFYPVAVSSNLPLTALTRERHQGTRGWTVLRGPGERGGQDGSSEGDHARKGAGTPTNDGASEGDMMRL